MSLSNIENASTLLKAIQKMRELHPDITASYIEIFLYVGVHKDITLGEMERKMKNLSKSSMSRALAILSDREKGVSYGPLRLIRQDLHPTDSRTRILTLTPKGEKLFNEITSFT